MAIHLPWGRNGLLSRLSGFKADLAAAILGALSAAALPPLHIFPVLFISFPGLLALIGAAPTPLTAARRGFWFALAHHIFGIYWITSAILIEASDFWWFVPLAVPLTALILTPFVAIPAALTKLTRPGWPQALMLAASWVLGDLARQIVATGFPWNLFGSALEFPGTIGSILIAPAALIGIHGLTFFTVLAATAPGQSRRFQLATLAGLAIWIAGGTCLYTRPASLSPGLTAVLVQGDETEKERQSLDSAVAGFQRSLALTRQGVAEAKTTPVVVWPEDGSTPYPLDQYAGARAAIAQAGVGATQFLIGSLRYGAPTIVYNSLIGLAASGTIDATYDKWHLVPFGEYTPPLGILGIKIAPGSGFSAGPGPRTLHFASAPPVGILICYEAVFSGQSVDESDRPRWLLTITDDAWFGNSSGPRQHLAAVRMRAVEEGLPILRAANTGISAGYDAHGNELGRIGLNQPGVLDLPIPGALARTLYSRFGLKLPLLLAGLSAALALILSYRNK